MYQSERFREINQQAMCMCTFICMYMEIYYDLTFVMSLTLLGRLRSPTLCCLQGGDEKGPWCNPSLNAKGCRPEGAREEARRRPKPAGRKDEPPLLPSRSTQALNELDEAPYIGGQSTASTDSNANPIQKYPHRHPQQ